MFRRLLHLCLPALILAGPLLAQTPFVPNDPFFSPYHGPAEPNMPAPGYYGQWHLVNQMPISAVNAGLDVNIAGAWARGLTGEGVIISIVDQGVEALHPEFVSKYRNEYSYSLTHTINENNAPGFIRGQPDIPGLHPLGDNHGVSVAGVAAAQGNNGIGVTGAAPYADIASIKFLTRTLPPGVTADQMQVAAILFQGQTDTLGRVNAYAPYTPPPGEFAPVRVKNHSYGYNNGFGEVDGMLWALETSASWGVINVVSAGNERGPEGAPTADSNKYQFATSTDVINVAALGSNGKYASYSSYGANVFVTAPSSSSGGYRISTTDRLTAENGYNGPSDTPEPYFNTPGSGPNDPSSYTSTFGGTSSSAPLVSGIMALGLQANPHMTVRMAQHLLARTSRIVDPTDTVTPTSTGGWVTNSAGFRFNNNYGFGLIDADAFTLAAAHTTSVTELVIHSSGDQSVGRTFSPVALTLTESVDVIFAAPLPLEYVQVHILITGLQTDWAAYMGDSEHAGIGAIIGDFEAWLTSPSGTKNRLFYDDRFITPEDWEADRDWRNHPTLDWTFTSYAYWGEDLNGLWTIDLTNNSTNLTSLGIWQDYSLDFGMGDVFIVPEPSTGILLILGLVAILRLTRRKTHAA